MASPTVFLVDDDPDVLQATQRLLESAELTVRGFNSPKDFLECCDSDVQGCVVLDLAMPELSGLELQRALSGRHISLPIVFLSGQADIRACADGMKQGAVDFLTKPVDDAELLEAVKRGLELDGSLRHELAERARVEASLTALTSREREVLTQVVAGRLNKQIASELGTVEKTVKFHRGNLMRKLGVRSVAELVRFAELAGITNAGS